MIYLQINTIDSLRKVIIDSVSNANSQNLHFIDYVNKVDSFYNNSWTKLAVLFGLIGIIIPLIISYIQNRKIDKDVKKIKDDILVQLRNETNKYLNKRIRVIQHASEGVSYSVQAQINLKEGKLEDAFHDYVTSLYCFYIGDDFCNFQITKKDFIENLLAKIDQNMLDKFDNSYSEYFDIESLIKRIEKSGAKEYGNEVYELKKALNTLPRNRSNINA